MVVERIARPIALLVFGVVIIGAVTAQPQTPAASQPRKLALFFDPSALNAEAQAKILLYQSLLQEVRRVAPKAEIIEFARQHGNALDGKFPTIPGNSQSRSNRALAESADSWLSVSLSGTPASLTVAYEFSDLLVAGGAVSASYRTALDSRYRNLSGGLWTRLDSVLKERLKAREVTVNITFVGKPGTFIRERNHPEMQFQMSGNSADLTVPAPGAYQFTVERPGSYPKEIPVRVSQSPVTVPADLQQKSPFSFDFSLTDFSFPAIWTDYQIIPESLYAQLGIETYLVGMVPLSFNNNNNGGPSLFASSGVTYVSLGLGTYLTGSTGVWKGTFRPFLTASGVLRVVTTSQYFGIDPILPGGGELVVGTEILPEYRIRGLFALVSRVFFSSDAVLAASQVSQDSAWKFHVLSWGIIEFPAIFVGVRFQP